MLNKTRAGTVNESAFTILSTFKKITTYMTWACLGTSHCSLQRILPELSSDEVCFLYEEHLRVYIAAVAVSNCLLQVSGRHCGNLDLNLNKERIDRLKGCVITFGQTMNSCHFAKNFGIPHFKLECHFRVCVLASRDNGVFVGLYRHLVR